MHGSASAGNIGAILRQTLCKDFDGLPTCIKSVCFWSAKMAKEPMCGIRECRGLHNSVIEGG